MRWSHRMSFADRLRAAIWRVPVGLQLSALYTLLLVTILALLGTALYTQLDQFLVQNTAARLEQATSTVLARNTNYGRGDHRSPDRHYGGPGSPDPAESPSSPARPAAPDLMVGFLVRDLSAPDVTVAVLNGQGTVLSSTMTFSNGSARVLPALPAGWIDQITQPSMADAATLTTQWIAPAVGGGRQLVLVQAINTGTFSPAPTQRLLLVQAASLDAADATLGQLRLYLILGILIGTIVGVLAGLAVTRAVLKPLDRMARTAEAIAAGDLHRRLHLPPGGNEIARLAGAFDHMVDRLATTLGAQRRFIADASHELRTPLTSLEGLSEMLLIGADRGDPSTIQRMARAMHTELGRLGRLVADLLTLSRLDSPASLTFTSVETGKLLDDVAEQVAPLAAARQIRLEVAHEGPIAVRADPDRLKQVLLNLVDNALRYTPPAGTVRLVAALDPAGATARLQVQDTGPGIAPDHLPHIFDRFYRGDPSRARASGNTGLGLAIARSIVEAHGGTIAAQPGPAGGAWFTIVLPAARPGDPAIAPGGTRRDRQPVSP
jgi:two-component system OmpR family sensor kinase